MKKWKSKIIKISFAAISVIILFSCSDFLSTESKPEKVERNITFSLVLKDNSGFMETLYGNSRVRGAEVTLKSNLLGTEYTLFSDSNGVVSISGILSDKYLVTANRFMTPEEMLVISGSDASNVKLTNKNERIIELNAAISEPLEVNMEVVIGSSPLIISEIYGSGPEGSGLYYHDKYVEIFNQSDSVQYLDNLMIAVVYASSYLGLNYRDDPTYVHSKSIWIFPGSGQDFPIQPGEFVVCAEDAIDHRINAPNSVDLSNSKFEFYKDDAPDVDNPAVPNMIRIYQPSGNDWLIGGEKGSLIIARFSSDSLISFDDQFLIPYRTILDGVEYLDDPTKLDIKILNQSIDAGATGGIQFYTGKSMERILISDAGRKILKDENNSSVDFVIIERPTPQTFH
ncbi:MAG: DUF4876 domain-containing protein [Ignavibacteriales bacterium]|nr:DUF4876 domain-containing protein [Ignavibacteriales bacterium]MCF8306960.1 DUF4876 domain-containing protein [Ignavibacteriales bacterium]MCF8437400.1 DUF4876 domain-containing protein [Ignavibacteriales bacterium]